jgi:hypothetical protein
MSASTSAAVIVEQRISPGLLGDWHDTHPRWTGFKLGGRKPARAEDIVGPIREYDRKMAPNKEDILQVLRHERPANVVFARTSYANFPEDVSRMSPQEIGVCLGRYEARRRKVQEQVVHAMVDADFDEGVMNALDGASKVIKPVIPSGGGGGAVLETYNTILEALAIDLYEVRNPLDTKLKEFNGSLGAELKKENSIKDQIKTEMVKEWRGLMVDLETNAFSALPSYQRVVEIIERIKQLYVDTNEYSKKNPTVEALKLYAENARTKAGDLNEIAKPEIDALQEYVKHVVEESKAFRKKFKIEDKDYAAKLQLARERDANTNETFENIAKFKVERKNATASIDQVGEAVPNIKKDDEWVKIHDNLAEDSGLNVIITRTETELIRLMKERTTQSKNKETFGAWLNKIDTTSQLIPEVNKSLEEARKFFNELTRLMNVLDAKKVVEITNQVKEIEEKKATLTVAIETIELEKKKLLGEGFAGDSTQVKLLESYITPLQLDKNMLSDNSKEATDNIPQKRTTADHIVTLEAIINKFKNISQGILIHMDEAKKTIAKVNEDTRAILKQENRIKMVDDAYLAAVNSIKYSNDVAAQIKEDAISLANFKKTFPEVSKVDWFMQAEAYTKVLPQNVDALAQFKGEYDVIVANKTPTENDKMLAKLKLLDAHPDIDKSIAASLPYIQEGKKRLLASKKSQIETLQKECVNLSAELDKMSLEREDVKDTRAKNKAITSILAVQPDFDKYKDQLIALDPISFSMGYSDWMVYIQEASNFIKNKLLIYEGNKEIRNSPLPTKPPGGGGVVPPGGGGGGLKVPYPLGEGVVEEEVVEEEVPEEKPSKVEPNIVKQANDLTEAFKKTLNAVNPSKTLNELRSIINPDGTASWKNVKSAYNLMWTRMKKGNKSKNFGKESPSEFIKKIVPSEKIDPEDQKNLALNNAWKTIYNFMEQNGGPGQTFHKGFPEKVAPAPAPVPTPAPAPQPVSPKVGAPYVMAMTDDDIPGWTQ